MVDQGTEGSLSRASVERLGGLGVEGKRRSPQQPQWAPWKLKITLCPVPKMWLRVHLKHSGMFSSIHKVKAKQL